jgi:hypothetical protein
LSARVSVSFRIRFRTCGSSFRTARAALAVYRSVHGNPHLIWRSWYQELAHQGLDDLSPLEEAGRVGYDARDVLWIDQRMRFGNG